MLPRKRLLFEKDAPSIDVLYGCYVDIYNSLDNLIWRNMATFLGVTVLGAGIMGALLGQQEIKLVHLTHNQTVATGFALISAFYALTIYIVRRMRIHHELLEEFLGKLEPNGYFSLRKNSARKWWRSAPSWVQIAFGLLMVLCVIFAFLYAMEPDMSSNKKSIGEDEAQRQFGIIASHEKMPNGELRFRLMGADGNGYIRTVATEGQWQNSHSHKTVAETYIVEHGWMALAYAEASNGHPEIHLVEPGGIITTAIDRVHNVYLPAGAVIHTVKHGNIAGGTSDWQQAPEFDSIIKKVTETELLTLRHSPRATTNPG